MFDCFQDKEEYQRHLDLLVADQAADGGASAAANEAQLSAQEDAEEAELAREEAELEEKLAALRREKQALHFGQIHCACTVDVGRAGSSCFV